MGHDPEKSHPRLLQTESMKEILLGRKSGCQQIGARKIQRFFSQAFHVAEQFTGRPGVYVTLDDDRVSCLVSLDPHRNHVRDDVGVREADLEALLARGEEPTSPAA